MVYKLIKDLLRQIRVSSGIQDLTNNLETLKSLQIESFYQQLKNSKQYSDVKDLAKSEYQVFSQFGEDGVIQEIFKRIGTTNKFFVEIGTGDGLENNTTNLLANNWKGFWLEGDGKLVKILESHFFHL
jgi:hypothetical protein